MPRRDDLRTILIIGSGPIVIGQGCEFDYSGTQACKALREEGYRVVLVNSNPATIMTDPEFSDRTYIEPITPEAVAKVIEAEKAAGFPVDALLPTLGGQTALNCACQLFDDGTLDKHGIEMIGADRTVIYRAEDREEFRNVVESIGLKMPAAGIARNMDQARAVMEQVGLPAIIRPAFTLGGTGGGVAYNVEEFEEIARRGLDASMTHQILIDQSVIGWKEYELEVMRDRDDNVVIICAIENFDAMGVHTGDSITVAPAQTLSDKEYQRMRDAALAIIRAIGVETGGSNIQFGVNPDNGELVVIEMNPRVSRSSALASKATGFPIAKIAAKLAVGYTLWELPNDITGETVACFEPTIDYVVTKLPRWTFEKFPEADETLTTQMKSVGEAMSIGRTFKESLQKGIRSMEVKRFGYGLDANDKWLAAKRSDRAIEGSSDRDKAIHAEGSDSIAGSLDHSIASTPEWPIDETKLNRKLSVPSQGRIYYVRYAFKMGMSVEQVHEKTHIDPWFLDQLQQLVEFEDVLCGYDQLEDLPREVMFQAKQMGYSDAQLANLYLGSITSDTILKVRARRKSLGVTPVYKLVDTCAAEFEAATPYYYSTYEAPFGRVTGDRLPVTGEDKAGTPAPSSPSPVTGHRSPVTDDEVRVTDKTKVMILGGGPNRIGQGIEFDYCCVQAAFAADDLGFESVMINSNPETVSTDYDTSDLLFFEPLTLEDVLNVYDRLNAESDRAIERSSDQDKTGDAPASDSVAGSLDHSITSDAGRVLGAIVQFGGQTPLNLAHGLEDYGVPIIGTPVDSIDLAEDRNRFKSLMDELGIQQPESGIAYDIDEAIREANRIGYPVLVRPSFVLGGRAMETVFDDDQLRHYMVLAIGASDLENQPILIDKFLAEATECDVDVVADFGRRSDRVIERSSDQVNASENETSNSITGSLDPSITHHACIAGVMEHIEEAGVHSGDSACTIPPHSLPPEVIERLKADSRRLAEAFKVHGLMNVQWAIAKPGQQAADAGGHEAYIIEVNPRASRTVPFVSKATGVPWARHAAKIMMGQTLADLAATEVTPEHVSVKESVFPFSKFPGVDVILGPEMRSTGECMGIDPSLPIAFGKAQMAAGTMLPDRGRVFLSVRRSDRDYAVDIGRRLAELGFEVLCTEGTAAYLAERGVETTRLKKISEGRPNAMDLIKNGELALIINTPTRKGSGTDEGKLRSIAVRFAVPMITTVTAARAAVDAIAALRADQWGVRPLQSYFPGVAKPTAAPVNP